MNRKEMFNSYAARWLNSAKGKINSKFVSSNQIRLHKILTGKLKIHSHSPQRTYLLFVISRHMEANYAVA